MIHDETVVQCVQMFVFGYRYDKTPSAPCFLRLPSRISQRIIAPFWISMGPSLPGLVTAASLRGLWSGLGLGMAGKWVGKWAEQLTEQLSCCGVR